jgi:hypothetical protein
MMHAGANALRSPQVRTPDWLCKGFEANMASQHALCVAACIHLCFSQEQPQQQSSRVSVIVRPVRILRVQSQSLHLLACYLFKKNKKSKFKQSKALFQPSKLLPPRQP